jgi:putative membrane protein
MNIQKPAYAIIFLLIIYSVGLVGLSLPGSRENFSGLTPVNLLISTLLLFVFHKTWNSKILLAFFIVLSGGFFIELAGVQTGLVFGTYTYGEALGPEISGTPLIIGLNWLILIYMVYSITESMNLSWYWQAILGAFIMLAYDMVLEPVAIQLDFWNWGGGIPLQNYLAWWIISLVFLLFWKGLNIKIANPIAKYLFLIQFVFFLILNITL